MTPSLFGRIQSRIILVLGIGWPLSLLLALVLPRPAEDTTYRQMLTVFLAAVLITAIVGVVWEFVYHGLQQFRWEKDWPTVFGVLTIFNEGLVVYFLLRFGIPWDFGEIPLKTFIPMFLIVWAAVWIIANGPLQIVTLRWRYRGGRFF